MWTREDIAKNAALGIAAAEQDGCHSIDIHRKIAMDIAAMMAIENAMDVADRYGEVLVRDDIEKLKDMFPLGER